jgi:murE/murF fusion protein
MNSAYLHSVAEVLDELHSHGFFADCSALISDHRALSGPQDVLIAIPGKKVDPRVWVDELLASHRCGLALVEYDEGRVYQSASVVPVRHLAEKLATLASVYYETAASSMRVVAVTGTNGKTTVTRWIAQALNALGVKAAVIGTLGYGLPDALKSHSSLTTPDVVGMHRVLHQLRLEGVQVVCIEASSIGLEQGRLQGVPIEIGVLTNLSQDHLDYHHSMEAYGQVKLLLASWPSLQLGVVNADDAFSESFRAVLQEHQKTCVTVGRDLGVDVQLISIDYVDGGLQLTLRHDELDLVFNANVQGEFNAENLALVYPVLLALGIDEREIPLALSQVSAPPGRMEKVVGRPCVIVDYAHTPDALERVLSALRPVAQSQGGRLLVVFGCGGDRDRTKRPQMGEIAARLADVVILTSDNPRSEVPGHIIQEIREGIPSNVDVLVEEDREAAVRRVAEMAEDSDVVLLAGKGHEQTQTIGKEVRPYSDVLVAQKYFVRSALNA